MFAFTLCFVYSQGSVLPFMDVRLSNTPGTEIADIAWNPGLDFAGLLISITSDGAIQMWNVTDQLTIVGSLPAKTNATCCEY